jgi:hypothetical protein
VADDANDEFDKLIERMSDTHAVEEVTICEIAEQASVVEVTVPMNVYDHPELTMFNTITAYVRSTPRRMIVSISVSYEIRGHALPHLVATLVLSDLN